MNNIRTALRSLFKRWRVAATFAGLYAALLGAAYAFIKLSEARLWQVILSLALALVVPVLFFIIQAMAASYAQTVAGENSLLGRALKDFWKLLLLSLPLILIAFLTFKLSGKVEARIAPAPVAQPTPYVYQPPASSEQAKKDSTPPLKWSLVLLSTMRLLVLVVLLPLAAIHLWTTCARYGLKYALKRAGPTLARAFSPRSVLIYMLGLVLFGLIPYLLLIKPIHFQRGWLEIGVFVLRLALVFALTLYGWALTVGILSQGSETEAAPQNLKSEMAVEA